MSAALLPAVHQQSLHHGRISTYTPALLSRWSTSEEMDSGAAETDVGLVTSRSTLGNVVVPYLEKLVRLVAASYALEGLCEVRMI